MEKSGIPIKLTSPAKAFVGPAPALEKYELVAGTKGLLTYEIVRLMDLEGRIRLYFIFIVVSVGGRVFEVFICEEKIEGLNFVFLHGEEAEDVITSTTNFLQQPNDHDCN
ncbi:MAG: hypothetical protein WC705_02800 [Candidatus Paceibacterota bacterium]|jgi:hypothetical protein